MEEMKDYSSHVIWKDGKFEIIEPTTIQKVKSELYKLPLKVLRKGFDFSSDSIDVLNRGIYPTWEIMTEDLFDGLKEYVKIGRKVRRSKKDNHPVLDFASDTAAFIAYCATAPIGKSLNKISGTIDRQARKLDKEINLGYWDQVKRFNKGALWTTAIGVTSATIMGLTAAAWYKSFSKVYTKNILTAEYIRNIQPDALKFFDRDNQKMSSLIGNSNINVSRYEKRGRGLDNLLGIVCYREDINNLDYHGSSSALGAVDDLNLIGNFGKAIYRKIFHGIEGGASTLQEQTARNIITNVNNMPQNFWFDPNSENPISRFIGRTPIGQIEAKATRATLATILAPKLYPVDGMGNKYPKRSEDVGIDYFNSWFVDGIYFGVDNLVRHRFNRSVNWVLTDELDMTNQKTATAEDLDRINMLIYMGYSQISPNRFNPHKIYENMTPAENEDIRLRAIEKANQLKNEGLKDILAKQIERGEILIHPDLIAECLKIDLKFEHGALKIQEYDHSNIFFKDASIAKLKELGIKDIQHYIRNIEKSGLSVNLSIDKEMQEAGLYFRNQALSRIKLEFMGANPVVDVATATNGALHQFNREQLRIIGKDKGIIYLDIGKLGKGIIDRSGYYSRALFDKLNVGDIITVGVKDAEKKRYDILTDTSDMKGAIIVTNSHGDLEAMVGGKFLTENNQFGSPYKLVVGNAAMRRGWHERQLLRDQKSFSIVQGKRWEPKNFKNKRLHDTTLEEAVAKSNNRQMAFLFYNMLDNMDIEGIRKEYERVLAPKVKLIPSSNPKRVDLPIGKIFFDSQYKINQTIFEMVKHQSYHSLRNQLGNSQKENDALFREMLNVHEYSFGTFAKYHEIFRVSYQDIENKFGEIREAAKSKNVIEILVDKASGLIDQLGTLIGGEPKKKEEKIVFIHDFIYKNGRVHYEPGSGGKNSLRGSELSEFLSRYKPEDIVIGRDGRFTLGDHQDYEEQKKRLSQVDPQKRLEELMLYDPQIRANIAVEIIKKDMKDLGIDGEPEGDLSLVLGTHPTSLLEFHRMLYTMLTTNIEDEYQLREFNELVTGIRKDKEILYQGKETNEDTTFKNHRLYNLMRGSKNNGTGRYLNPEIFEASKTGSSTKTAFLTAITNDDRIISFYGGKLKGDINYQATGGRIGIPMFNEYAKSMFLK